MRKTLALMLTLGITTPLFATKKDPQSQPQEDILFETIVCAAAMSLSEGEGAVITGPNGQLALIMSRSKQPAAQQPQQPAHKPGTNFGFKPGFLNR